MNIFPHEPNINWMGHMRLLVGVSIALTVGGFAVGAARGLNFGIDFAGGYEIQVRFDKDVSEERMHELLKPLNLGEVRVQRYGKEGEHEYLVLLRKQSSMSDQEKAGLKASVEELAGGPEGLLDWSVAESGERLTARFAKGITEPELRKVLEGRRLKVKGITTGERADTPEYHVMLVSVADDIEAALKAGVGVPANQTILRRVEFVGPQVGAELRTQAALAVFWALFFIMLYIAVRFDMHFAPGAIVALVHDLGVTIGVFAIFQLEFNMQALAALLTIVGYSINDTIVTYDRIRENIGRLRGRELRALVNSSINQTLSRTILTSGVTQLAVAALMVLGGGVVRELSTALFVGIIAGTYSSISIASPMYIWLKERAQRAGKGEVAPASSSEAAAR